MKKITKKVGTHNGKFHGDEVMATAILKEIFEIELTRTRDPKILEQLDIVYDVGGGEFDHHGIEKVYRDDGIPYAACGLIWNKFGREVIFINESSLIAEEIQWAFDYVDQYLIEGIDAQDNGIRTGEELVPTMNISRIISDFNPPWYSDESEYEAFNKAVGISTIVLRNTIKRIVTVLKSRDIVTRAYESRKTPEILVLDIFCPWEEILSDIDENEEVNFVVFPNQDNYAVRTVRDENGKDKIPLPESWAGKEHSELAEITGIKDSVFCHTGRFVAVAGSLESVIKMAKIAINIVQA